MVESRPLYQLSHNHCRWKLFFVYLSIAIWTDFLLLLLRLFDCLRLTFETQTSTKAWTKVGSENCPIVWQRRRKRERERERVSANIEWERERAGLESERVVVSVWPDLAKFRHFGKIIEAIGNFWGFIYFLSKLLPTLAKFICHWTKLDCCKWTNMEN